MTPLGCMVGRICVLCNIPSLLTQEVENVGQQIGADRSSRMCVCAYACVHKRAFGLFNILGGGGGCLRLDSGGLVKRSLRALYTATLQRHMSTKRHRQLHVVDVSLQTAALF